MNYRRLIFLELTAVGISALVAELYFKVLPTDVLVGNTFRFLVGLFAILIFQPAFCLNLFLWVKRAKFKFTRVQKALMLSVFLLTEIVSVLMVAFVPMSFGSSSCATKLGQVTIEGHKLAVYFCSYESLQDYSETIALYPETYLGIYFRPQELFSVDPPNGESVFSSRPGSAELAGPGGLKINLEDGTSLLAPLAIRF